MSEIRVNPGSVDTVAGVFSQKAEESLSMASQLKAKVSELGGQWQGMAKERFYGDYETWDKQMQNHVELLRGISTELKRIAQIFREAERLAAGK